MLPEFSFLDVGEADLPVLAGLVDARQEPPALLFLRKMQEELDDVRAVAVQMTLQAEDRPVALLPDVVFVRQVARNALTLEDLRMHAHDQHLFVIGAIEDADASPLRQVSGRAPEKIVLELLGARMLEA